MIHYVVPRGVSSCIADAVSFLADRLCMYVCHVIKDVELQ